MSLLTKILKPAGAAIDAVLSRTEEKTCKHPPHQRKDYSTMGVKRWHCQVCGYVHEERGD